MYIDKQGVEYPNIILLMEDTEDYLKGWYFVDETFNFGNMEPLPTLEEAEKQLKAYGEFYLK